MDEEEGNMNELSFCDKTLDQIVVNETPTQSPDEDGVSLTCLSPYVQPSSKDGIKLTSPIKTLETMETIVSTNKISVYSTVELNHLEKGWCSSGGRMLKCTSKSMRNNMTLEYVDKQAHSQSKRRGGL